MTTNFDVNNPVNYKACRLKQYDIHVCMPSKGTYIVNKFETPSIFEAVKKEYFTEKELKELSEKGSQVFKDLQYGLACGLVYVVDNQTPFVVCGTMGELKALSPAELASTYTFIQDGKPLPINQQTLNQRMKDGFLDWTLIRTSPQATQVPYMACFVPSKYKFKLPDKDGYETEVNIKGNHGLGDFIICSKL